MLHHNLNQDFLRHTLKLLGWIDYFHSLHNKAITCCAIIYMEFIHWNVLIMSSFDLSFLHFLNILFYKNLWIGIVLNLNISYKVTCVNSCQINQPIIRSSKCSERSGIFLPPWLCIGLAILQVLGFLVNHCWLKSEEFYYKPNNALLGRVSSYHTLLTLPAIKLQN